MGAVTSLSILQTTEQEQQAESARLVGIFQKAVLRAAGVIGDGSTCASGSCGASTNDMLRKFFEEADTNHDGVLDQSELENIIEKVNIDINDEDKAEIRKNMKDMLLSLETSSDGLYFLFDQFVEALNFSCAPECHKDVVSTDPKRIVFVGGTGAGKSALCTVLTGQDKNQTSFKIGKGASSETTTCTSGQFNWFGNPADETFVCIDTPGLDDELGRDDEHINNIIEFLRSLEYINAIVLVMNGQNPRFSTSLQKMIKQFERAFTPKFYDHSVICLTRWFMDKESVAEREEDGHTETQVAAELNTKLRNSKTLGCENLNIPVVFVDSFYQRKDPSQGKERLAAIKNAVTDKVFRTAELARIKPRIIQINNSSELMRNGVKIATITPVLFDEGIAVSRWEVRPPLPAGLVIEEKRGWISGVPTVSCPSATYNLLCCSAGGWSDEFPMVFEVALSAAEVKEIVAVELKQANVFMENLLPVQEDNPLTVEETTKAVESARAKSLSHLQDLLDSLAAKYGNFLTFVDMAEVLKTEYERRFIQIERDFMVSNQKALGAATDRSKIEKDLQIQILRENTNVDTILRFLSDAEQIGADESIIEKAKAWLAMIQPTSCCNQAKGCSYNCMKKDLHQHEKCCLFGFILYGKESLETRPSTDSKNGILITCSIDQTWSGKYVWDEDDQEFYFFNQNARRLQRIHPQASEIGEESGEVTWVADYKTSTDGPETLFSTSKNSVADVLDASFEDFTIERISTYAWSQQKVPRSPNPESVKLIYFGGKWCPYCPPFTAVLARFYSSVCKQYDDKALDVIFMSSDRTELQMMEYFMEEHGNWLVLPFEDQTTNDAFSEKCNVDGIPTCALVNNNMELLSDTPFLNDKSVRECFKELPESDGPDMDVSAWKIFQLFQGAIEKSLGAKSTKEKESFDVFCSLRYAESLHEAKQVVVALKQRAINATIIDIPEGDDIAAAVSDRLEQAKLAIIFGSETYGVGTTSYSTKEELQFIMD